MVLGFALAIFRCRKTGINKEHIYNLALWPIPVCIICARAYYVIFFLKNCGKETAINNDLPEIIPEFLMIGAFTFGGGYGMVSFV